MIYFAETTSAHSDDIFPFKHLGVNDKIPTNTVSKALKDKSTKRIKSISV